MLKMFKNIIAFMKPRVVFVILLVVALLFSAVVFAGEIHTFVINYGKESLVVRNLSASIDNAIACAGIDNSIYKVDTAENIGKKTVISLLKTFPVHVMAAGNTITVKACESDTVAGVLNLAGFTADEYDMVEPALDSVLGEETYIDYVNVDYVSGSYTQAIPYSVETVYSNSLELGKKSTVAGKDGIEQINYTQKIVDGKVVETSVDSRVTLLAAKNSVQTVGTRRIAVKTSDTVSCISELSPSSPIELDSSGNPVSYKKHVTVQATAYTYTGHNCSTGVAPKPGYIAVNPKIIPYGTKMYIKSSDGKYIYGYAIAADTGGFIKTHPTNVDLFFPTKTSMNNFGRRNVEIYILE